MTTNDQVREALETFEAKLGKPLGNPDVYVVPVGAMCEALKGLHAALSAPPVDAERVRVLVSRMKDWMLRHGASKGLWTLAERDMLTEAAKVIVAPPVDAERVREDLRETTHLLRCLVAGSIERDSEQIDAVAEEAERWLKRHNALTPTPAAHSQCPDNPCPGVHPWCEDVAAAPSPGAPTCIHCGKPATYIGRYEDATEDTPACDECCGHGNEDGHCELIAAPSPDAATEDEWGVRRFRSAQRVRAFLTDSSSPDAATGGEDEEEEFKPEDICTRCRATRAEHSGRDAYDRSCEAFTMATPAPSKPSAPGVAQTMRAMGVSITKEDAVVNRNRAALGIGPIVRDLDYWRRNYEAAERDCTEARAALSAATAENARLREERDEAREAARIAEKTCGDLRREAAIWDANVGAALRAKLAASETRCAGLQREHDLTARVATEQRQRAEELAAKLADAERELREQERRADAFEDELSDARGALDNAYARENEQRERAEDLAAKLVEAEARPSVEVCKAERAKGNGGCGACALCCKEQRERADELAAKLAEAEYDLGKANKAITLYKQSCAERKQRADAAEAKLAEAERLRAFDTGARELPKGVMLEYQRLDGMWRKLVKEKDEAKERADAAEAKLREYLAELGPLISPRQWAENFNALAKERDAAEARAKEAEAKSDRIFAVLTEKERRIGEAVEAIKSLTPEGHYGSDPDNAPCDETCAHENGEGAEQHRPDIGDDRCDREDECYRCIALNALESLTPPGEKDNNSSNHGGSTR